MRLFVTLWTSWVKFWFKPIDLLPAAVFRISISIVLFLMYALRQVNLLEYYSDRSMVPHSTALELLPENYRPLFYWFPVSDFGITAFHFLLLFALLMILVGFYSRIFSFIALCLAANFLHRNPAVAYGSDIIACYWLFYLSFIESDHELSLRAKLKLPRLGPKFSQFSLSTVGVRLVQIQLCIIYGYTGFEKLKGASWWEGTAVWQVMGNQQLSTMNLSFLQNFPLLVVFMTYTTMLFEIYFPICVWIPKIRPWWLAVGFLFHVGIALTMGLVFFAGVMVAGYPLYFNGESLRRRLNLQRAQV